MDLYFPFNLKGRCAQISLGVDVSPTHLFNVFSSGERRCGVFSFTSLDFFRNDPVGIKFLQLSVYLYIFLLSCFFSFFPPFCDSWLRVIAEFSHQERVCPLKGNEFRIPSPLPGLSAAWNADFPSLSLDIFICSLNFSFQINSQIQKTKSSCSRWQQTPWVFPLWEQIMKLEFSKDINSS